ncbi:MAG: hypothetical protein U1U88_001651 [Lawsonella clevelandensis]
MQTAASVENTPPVYLGNVMEVQRLTRNIAIIRLHVAPPHRLPARPVHVRPDSTVPRHLALPLLPPSPPTRMAT